MNSRQTTKISAGAVDTLTIAKYGMPVMSAMMNIAAPMSGGMTMPMVEAVASKAAATCGGYPERFISGMVSVPVLTTLAAAAPEIMPKSALATTATFAG